MPVMIRAILVSVLLASFAAPVWADWYTGDDHKMHFPQRPDPSGWDIEFVTFSHQLADDWRCGGTGPVDDLHFWYSVQGDGPTPPDMTIIATIYDDDRSGLYSKPGQPLWSYTFGPGQYTVRLNYGSGSQGFADPQQGTGGWEPADHLWYHQVNITGISRLTEPFVQTRDTIYWLGLYVMWTGTNPPLGWKTADVSRYPPPYTGMHFEDDAVYWQPDYFGAGQGAWLPLKHPFTNASLDLAFVITPEPATWVLLAGGMLAMMMRRR